MTDAVRGRWDQAFDGVVAAFAQTVTGAAGGAALTVRVGGHTAVSVHGGWADADLRWEADTPTVVFSCTKGIASVVVAMLLDRGLISSLDEPLARYWPEFAHAGKGSVSIGDALAHRAGVPGPDRDLTLAEVLDGHTLAENIAAMTPLWEPGTAHTYHPLTHGVLTEQLVLRTDGRSLGRFIAEEIAGPRGLDLWLGAGAETAVRRARPILGEPATTDFVPSPGVAERVEHFLTFGGAFPPRLTGRDVGFDDPAVLAAGLGGAGALATADGLAGFWAAVVDPSEPLVSAGALRALTALRGDEEPRFASIPAPYHRWGAGVALSSERQPLTSSAAFGHAGAGGQVAFADPSRHLGVAYVTNLMIDTARGDAVVRELSRVL
ncbi:serine hydrolase domain-containing protein [Microbacterium sp. ZW T5_56]|uniref:serine hydrolase domain-containing protein n=1 Tax=Microbacterium sp. ZW T5_56 TaxID=3378081 RepID=UPI003852580C